VYVIYKNNLSGGLRKFFSVAAHHMTKYNLQWKIGYYTADRDGYNLSAYALAILWHI